jgi:hypothetical protein
LHEGSRLRRCERVHGTPASAVRGDETLDTHGGDVGDRLGNQRLEEAAGEMETDPSPGSR